MNKKELECSYRNFQKQSADAEDMFRSCERSDRFGRIIFGIMIAISGITMTIGLVLVITKGV